MRTHTHTHTYTYVYTHMCSLSPLLHCSKQLSSLYLIVAMAFGWPTCFPSSSSYLLVSQQPGWCFSVHIILCNSFIQKTVSQPTWFGSWFHLLMKSSLWLISSSLFNLITELGSHWPLCCPSMTLGPLDLRAFAFDVFLSYHAFLGDMFMVKSRICKARETS